MSEGACGWLGKHADAAGLGLLFWSGIALLIQLHRFAPAWLFVLAYAASACWLTGWILIGLGRFWKWLRK